jgi:hypothetical protein
VSGRWVVVARWHKMDKSGIDAGGGRGERERRGRVRLKCTFTWEALCLNEGAGRGPLKPHQPPSFRDSTYCTIRTRTDGRPRSSRPRCSHG